MTWDELIAKLRREGAPEALLPVHGHAEGRLGLRKEHARFVVSITERAEAEDLAEFDEQEDAIDFIYDNSVFQFKLKR